MIAFLILLLFCLRESFCFRSSHFLTKANPQNFSKAYAIQNIVSGSDFTLKLEECKDGNMLYVVEFAKSHCQPCQKVAPGFEKLSEAYKESVICLKVDADTSPEVKSIMKAQGIRSVPTFHIWLKGEKIDTINGANIEDLEDCVRSNITKLPPQMNL